MGNEYQSGYEFMQKPGDFFVARKKIHILSSVSLGFTPADSECEEYVARCGLESQSWGMPSQGVGWAKFITSVEEEEKEWGTEKCQECFEAQPEKPKVTIAQLTKDGDLLIEGKLYSEVTENGFTVYVPKISPKEKPKQKEPKNGDLFILSLDKLIHVLDHSEVEESPSGIEHDIYYATCGARNDGYVYKGELNTASFIPSAKEGFLQGARKCEKCNPKDAPVTEVEKLAEELKSLYMTDGNYISCLKLYVNSESKTEMRVGYENSDRLNNTGPEDTLPDLYESPVDWPGVGKFAGFNSQLKRAMDLAKELGVMIVIHSGDKTGYVINGKINMNELGPEFFLGDYNYDETNY